MTLSPRSKAAALSVESAIAGDKLPGAVGRMFGIPVYSTTPSISQAPGLVGVFAVNLLVPVALRQCGSAGERFKAKERRI